MKIRSISFANAVKIGNTQVEFAQSDKYDIVIKDVFCVRLEEKADGRKKSGLAVAYTTLFNVKWWHPEAEDAQVAEKMKAEAAYMQRAGSPPQQAAKPHIPDTLGKQSASKAARPTE